MNNNTRFVNLHIIFIKELASPLAISTMDENKTNLLILFHSSSFLPV